MEYGIANHPAKTAKTSNLLFQTLGNTRKCDLYQQLHHFNCIALSFCFRLLFVNWRSLFVLLNFLLNVPVFWSLIILEMDNWSRGRYSVWCSSAALLLVVSHILPGTVGSYHRPLMLLRLLAFKEWYSLGGDTKNIFTLSFHNLWKLTATLD